MIAKLKSILTNKENLAILFLAIIAVTFLFRTCKDSYNEYLSKDPAVEHEKDSIKQEISTRETGEAERSAEEEKIKKETITTQKNQKQREKQIWNSPVDSSSAKRVTQYFRKLRPGSNP